eukprot:GHVU01122194.1.p2 GENE.GHVU01122194.1~~GHVU01122194.1.p2  ORF type:complete len:106 (-),score=13.05 GHVU01122194.1:262-579(-)
MCSLGRIHLSASTGGEEKRAAADSASREASIGGTIARGGDCRGRPQCRTHTHAHTHAHMHTHTHTHAQTHTRAHTPTTRPTRGGEGALQSAAALNNEHQHNELSE